MLAVKRRSFSLCTDYLGVRLDHRLRVILNSSSQLRMNLDLISTEDSLYFHCIPYKVDFKPIKRSLVYPLESNSFTFMVSERKQI